MQTRIISQKIFIILMITVLLTSFLPVSPAKALFTINETFSGTSAPGWNLSGDAVLTENTIDSGGALNGWLRLTSANTFEAGSAIYNTPFSSNDGIQVEFSYAAYGGTATGADGFTFYLIDGTTTTPTLGPSGGALGYANVAGNLTKPGVTNGYVGIGFDEFGNFNTSSVGTCIYTPCDSSGSTDEISIRGSGTLSSGFDLLYWKSISPGNIDGVIRTGSRKVRITILDNTVTVEMDSGAGYVTQIDNKSLSVSGQANMPDTFKMGFSASTGASTNIHEIGNLTVTGLKKSTSTTTTVKSSACTGAATINTTVSVNAGGYPKGGTVSFYDGSTYLGEALVKNNSRGKVSLTRNSLTPGTHTFITRYSGTPGTSGFGISQATVSKDIVSGVCPANYYGRSSMPATGFAPNKISRLPAQPANKSYAKTDLSWMEIPSQKIKANIVGVPKVNETWDVTWLGRDAGWLNGTAYPSWKGNSVITAHVTDANGSSGPFANLKNLVYGDKIYIHQFGQKYTFEVRDTRQVDANSTTYAFEHLPDSAYLTMITCQGYNFFTNSYLFRRVVRAVLVSVISE
ncbi:MAG: sortase [Chloroflexota bacterium]